ncbi:hypothetical protein FQA39_LY15462 [Lamprigera yunnana]|nr:hypothetical protein FQA39_LY15462 [Lamprigera yunnana]
MAERNKKRPLSDKGILKVIENWDQSEDEYDSSDIVIAKIDEGTALKIARRIQPPVIHLIMQELTATTTFVTEKSIKDPSEALA